MIAAPTETSLRVFVIESQRLFGKALCQVFALDAAVQIVGDSHAVDPQALYRARPDLIILDLDGSQDVTEGLAVCRDTVPQARVCVLSMRPQAGCAAMPGGRGRGVHR